MDLTEKQLNKIFAFKHYVHKKTSPSSGTKKVCFKM